MAEKVTLKLSAAAAAYVRGDAPKEERLKAARGEIPFSANDQGTLLLFLSLDADPEVKASAVKSLREMPDDLLTLLTDSPETHPKVLDLLARIHSGNRGIIENIIANPSVEARTLEFLAAKEVSANPLPAETSRDPAGPADPEKEKPEDEKKEGLSKFQLCQRLNVAGKIKYAILGDKEWRSLLIKDTNKVVSCAVIKNPRITEPEILAIAKSKVPHDEILRLICKNREWTKLYNVRKALVENYKTPLPDALRFLPSLSQRDLSTLAKNKNVVSVISQQARRLLVKSKNS